MSLERSETPGRFQRFFFGQRGITLVEILITITIIFVLASVAAPISKIVVKRGKELELRRELRILRSAIDQFKMDWDSPDPKRRISHLESDVGNEETGYPVSLEILVEGAPTGDVEGTSRKYLRRIPKDPLTGEREWGLRCYQDPPDETSWCGDDVFDVFSLSTGTGLDGIPYREW